VRTNKAAYVVGEPVFVILNVKNIGSEAVGYSYCDGQVDLAVDNTEKKQPPNLWGCSSGVGGGFGCAIDHPPMLAPNKSVSFQYLLTDYGLRAGNYVLRAKGKAGVRWKYYPSMAPNAPPSPPPQHKEGDSVPGATFDISLPIAVAVGSQEELRLAYAPYIVDAESPGAGAPEMRRAREAIAEMAPAFLEKTVAGFASGPTPTPSLAVKGLGQINSAESRADLISLYDKSTDLTLRNHVAHALAGLATPDELQFFVELLPGRSTEIDDRIRQSAALGLGHIGGDIAARALARGLASPSAQVRLAVAAALGNTRSRSAVSLLIRMYDDNDNTVRNEVCGALIELTHREWCDGSGTSLAVQQSRWLQWWKLNAPQIALYGNDECPKPNVQLPSLH
jgi:HEAT repeat protein